MNNEQRKSRAAGMSAVILGWGAAAGLSVASMLAFGAPVDSGSAGTAPPSASPTASQRPSVQLDRSGARQVGKASFYAKRYSGRTMSNGKPMRLYSNNAASLTLPLGTTARVTNLETGLAAVVTIEDRGPYVSGRIIDLSPGTARRIGLKASQGLANVEVVPLTVPLADGTVKVVAQAPVMAANSTRP